MRFAWFAAAHAMLDKLTRRLLRSRSERSLDALRPLLAAAEAEGPAVAGLTDARFAERARQLEAHRAAEPAADAAMAGLLALAVEACRRTFGYAPRPEQLLAALVMHRGGVAEMRTGEGKTLAAALAVLPDAMSGNGVHVVTTNEYLAARDAEWMGPFYARFGLEAAVTRAGQTLREKRRAYRAQVTYASHAELGFDYLRDHLRFSPFDAVQGGRRFALLDEVDSILIDEVRTPLVVGALEDVGAEPYVQVITVVEALAPDVDYSVEPRSRTAHLTDRGIEGVEARLRGAGLLRDGALYDAANAGLFHVVQQCLAARALYQRDVHYTLTEDGRVAILDAFSGRTLAGRRWTDGLHQAVEAKERVPLRSHQRAQATCSYRSLFAGYAKLAGMSGTTAGVEKELEEVHGLAVVHVPPHRPLIRVDAEDALFATEAEKLEALVADVAARHRRGQPVLLGAPTEAMALELGRRLDGRGVPHQVLLARHHAEEAAIVARAGCEGAVTVATQLAGRGTDILLGGGDAAMARRVAGLGGLYVVGAERHRARRVDDQLRGRAGRQGDPGESRFYVSLEDRGVLRHREDAARALRDALAASSPGRSRARLEAQGRALVTEAQAIDESVEAQTRRQVRELDGVLDRQREAFYALRGRILRGTRRAPSGDAVGSPSESPAAREGAELYLARSREPLRRLLMAHRADSAKGAPELRPRMLARELFQSFGCALDPEALPRAPEALFEHLHPRVAASLRDQHARLTHVLGRVARGAVEEARWGEPGAARRVASDLEALGLPAPEGLAHATDEAAAVELARSALRAAVRERAQRDRLPRLLRYFRLVYLRSLDDAWGGHLGAMLALRDGISLRAVGGDDPAHAFQKEAHEAYLSMRQRAEREAVAALLAAPPLEAELLRRFEDELRSERLRRAARRDPA